MSDKFNQLEIDEELEEDTPIIQNNNQQNNNQEEEEDEEENEILIEDHASGVLTILIPVAITMFIVIWTVKVMNDGPNQQVK